MRTAALKKRWDAVLQKETLARMQVTVKHDHTYFDQPTSIMSANTRPLEQSLQEGSPEMIHYQVHVALSKEKIIALEAETHGQSDDILWFMERQKRITASIVKRVACLREITPWKSWWRALCIVGPSSLLQQLMAKKLKMLQDKPI